METQFPIKSIEKEFQKKEKRKYAKQLISLEINGSNILDTSRTHPFQQVINLIFYDITVQLHQFFLPK